MKVLITGGTGMVGKNLVNYLQEFDYEVDFPNRLALDLFDYDSVEEYLQKSKPDIVIHCAGKVGGIQANIANPVDFLVNNFEMGKNIVLASRNTSVKKLLNLGSSCMYPRAAVNPLKEETILTGELEPTNEGYALAKISIARLCDYVRKEDSSFQYKTIIPCNLYGHHDKFDPEHSHMIPAVIRKIHEAKDSDKKSVEIWGKGDARREFMNVVDLVEFVKIAIDRFDELPNLLNVGLGEDYSINDYYKAVAKVLEYEGEFTHDLTKPAGMKQKLVDVTRLRQFGWKHRLSLEDGIKLTYVHYLDHIAGE